MWIVIVANISQLLHMSYFSNETLDISQQTLRQITLPPPLPTHSPERDLYPFLPPTYAGWCPTSLRMEAHCYFKQTLVELGLLFVAGIFSVPLMWTGTLLGGRPKILEPVRVCRRLSATVQPLVFACWGIQLGFQLQSWSFCAQEACLVFSTPVCPFHTISSTGNERLVDFFFPGICLS